MGMLSSHIANAAEPDLEEMDNYLTLQSPPPSSPTTRSSPSSSSSCSSSFTSSHLPYSSPRSPCSYSPAPTPTLALTSDPHMPMTSACPMDIQQQQQHHQQQGQQYRHPYHRPQHHAYNNNII